MYLIFKQIYLNFLLEGVILARVIFRGGRKVGPLTGTQRATFVSASSRAENVLRSQKGNRYSERDATKQVHDFRIFVPPRVIYYWIIDVLYVLRSCRYNVTIFQIIPVTRSVINGNFQIYLQAGVFIIGCHAFFGCAPTIKIEI